MPCTMLSNFTTPFHNLIQLLIQLIKIHTSKRIYPPFRTLDVVSMCNPLERENPIWINMYPKGSYLAMIHITPELCSYMMLITIESNWPHMSDLMRVRMTLPWLILPWISNIFIELIMYNPLLKNKCFSCQSVWIIYQYLHRPSSCAPQIHSIFYKYHFWIQCTRLWYPSNIFRKYH